MKLPRDLSGDELVKALSRFGYKITRQTGSHIRLVTLKNGEHHVTIPKHKPLKVGTLNSILKEIADHLEMERDDLINKLK